MQIQGLREEENLQIYKAPELAWDLDVRTIAVESECNGWPLEVFHGKCRQDTRDGRHNATWKKKIRTPKSTMGMSPKPTPQSRHSVRLQFCFFIFTKVSVHRHHLPHLKCESEGTFSLSPTPGHSRYVTIQPSLMISDSHVLSSHPPMPSIPAYTLNTCVRVQHPCVRPRCPRP